MASPSNIDKTLRGISHALNRLVKPGVIFAPSVDDFRAPDALARVFQLQNRMLMLSQEAKQILRAIVDGLREVSAHNNETTYSDTYAACEKVLVDLLGQSLWPSDGKELLDLVDMRLSTKVDEQTFAVPLYGIELVDFDQLELGRLKVVRSDPAWLSAQGVTWNQAADDAPDAGHYKYWLVGTAIGSPDVALRRFRTDAQLAVGMLAIAAASIHERGALRIRIGVVMTPETAHGGARYLSWTSHKKDLTRHYQFVASQDFKIDGELVMQFADSKVFFRAFELLQDSTKTELGEAFARAVYWYSDAHREVVSVMKLVKFWSCVETFFSADKKDITQSVSAGLTCVLVFGGFDFIKESAYVETRRRVTELYDHRSKAVHSALYDHVSDGDIATLSQWVAWMLINMVSFVDRGYTRIGEIKKAGDDIDARLMAAGKVA